MSLQPLTPEEERIAGFPIYEQIPTSAGPRKRLLPLKLFRRGDLIHHEQQGENMLVLRSDDRGVLVRRAVGSRRAAQLSAGDGFVRVCGVDMAEWGF